MFNRRHAAIGALLIASCASPPEAQPPSVVATTTDVVASIEPIATSHWLSDAAVDRAMLTRRVWGLRYDEPWVRSVATDPVSGAGIATYSIPLLPDEIAELDSRALARDEVMEVVEAYGEQQPEWAGAYGDPASGGVFAKFTDDVEEHEAALRARLHPGNSLMVLDARWTFAALRDLQSRITQDAARLRSRGYHLLGVGVDVAANQTFVDVSTSDPDVAAFFARRFDADGMLVIRSDGTAVVGWQTGTLRGEVVDENGKAMPGVLIELDADVDGAGPRSDIGHATGPTGRFEFEDVTAVGYTVLVLEEAADGSRQIGSARAFVRPDQVTEVTIEVDTR